MRGPLLTVLIAVTVAASQDKPMPQPDRSLPVGQQQTGGALPSFDLPEFVITGRESIDLPVAEKRNIPSAVQKGPIVRPSGPRAERSGITVAGGGMPQVSAAIPSPHLLRAYLSVGSFSSVTLGVQAAGPVENVRLQADAEYGSTKGYAPNTDANHMTLNAGARAPTSILSGVLSDGQVAGEGSYSTNTYRWFGTATPDVQRRFSGGNGTVGMSGLLANGARVGIGFSFAGAGVSDSSARVSESVFRFRGDVGGLRIGLPVDLSVGGMTGSRTGGPGGSYGGMEAGIGFSWSPAELFSTRISVGFATLSGDSGQERTVFVPGFSAIFAITPQHRFVGTYAPRVEMQTLSGLMSIMPFIDAGQPIRHAFIRNRGTIGVESDWTAWLRTSVSLEAATWNDYPVVADTGKTGVFGLYYGNVTETLVRFSTVAKLPVNHYFSAIAILRSSKGSSSGLSVPYLPTFELTVTYRNELTERLEIGAAVQLVSARQTQVVGQSVSAAGYTRADAQVTYSILAGLKAWAAVRNLLGSRIEHWDGYKEAPFGLNIGVAYSF